MGDVRVERQVRLRSGHELAPIRIWDLEPPRTKDAQQEKKRFDGAEMPRGCGDGACVVTTTTRI